MKTTKHFAQVALLVLGATLSASTPAMAQVDVGTIDLVNTGLLPGASGQATLTDVVYVGDNSFSDSQYYVEYYTGELTLTCQGLKPGAKYMTPIGVAKAAPDGTLNLSGRVSYDHTWWYGSDVWWMDPYWHYLGGGLSVNVSNYGNKKIKIVLSGGFSYPY
jgi:hypothetical protein